MFFIELLAYLFLVGLGLSMVRLIFLIRKRGLRSNALAGFGAAMIAILGILRRDFPKKDEAITLTRDRRKKRHDDED